MSDSEPSEIVERSPQKVGAVIALIQSGVTHYATIARATGLTEEDVRRIDDAKDQHIQDLALRGTGRDVYYHLRSKIACPRCGSIIYLVPCVACTVAKSADVTETDSRSPIIPGRRALFPASQIEKPPCPEEQHHGS